LYLLNGLYLTAEQQAKLADIHRRTLRYETRFESNMDKLLRRAGRDIEHQTDAIAAAAARGRMKDSASLDSLNRGGRLREYRRDASRLRGEHNGHLDRMSSEVYDLLSESQRQIVRGFVPCFIPARDFRDPERVGQAAQDNTVVENALTKLRRLPEDKCFDSGLDIALSRIIPEVMHKRHVRYTPEAETQARDELEPRLRAAVERARKLDDADFDLDRSALAAAVFSPVTESGTDEGATRWKIRHYLLNTGISDVMDARAKGTSAAMRPADVRPDRRPLDAVGEMRTAALIGGLNLSPGQATGILSVVRSAVEARQNVERSAADCMREAIGPYMTLRRGLAAGEPGREDEHAAAVLHGRVIEIREIDLVEALLPKEREMDSLLSASQLALLLPPEEDGPAFPRRQIERHAERAEDIRDSRREARTTLGEVRRMSAIEFRRRGEQVARDFVAASLPAGGSVPRDRVGDEVSRVLKVFTTVRAMGDAEFRAASDDMAAEICPRAGSDRPAEYGTRFRNGKPLPVLSETTRLLFTECACAILEKMAGS
jgi:hypothetical protein